MRIVVFLLLDIMYLKIESVSNDTRFPSQSSNRKTYFHSQNTPFQVPQTQYSPILQILVLTDLAVRGAGKASWLNFDY